MCFRNSGRRLLLFAALFITSHPYLCASELLVVSEENFDLVSPSGKEVDVIYGDLVLRNRQVIVVIAQPTAGRNANMTTRGVSGMIIDYTRRNAPSDQLSCFYPAAGRYVFEEAQKLVCLVDGQQVDLSGASQFAGKRIEIAVTGTAVSKDGTVCQITYSLDDSWDYLGYQVQIQNLGGEARQVTKEDLLRCDGTLFRTGQVNNGQAFYAEDEYFGQAYAVMPDSGSVRRVGTGRNIGLQYADDAKQQPLSPEQKTTWSGKLLCSHGLPGILSQVEALATGQKTFPFQLKLQDPNGPIVDARVELSLNGKSQGVLHSRSDGVLRSELLPGEYVAIVRSFGREDREHSVPMKQQAFAESLSFPVASRVIGSITDTNKEPIAAKIQFIGQSGTSDPDFGPDSAVSAIKNLVYCARGKFEQPIASGKYRVLVSHGPEYDVSDQIIDVLPGQAHQLNVVLTRTVDTSGWISSEFHSHSSPSGDNVSHQTGRVLNLLAEHLEFAPCTEHNRIDTYEDDLELLGATGTLATCSGMELTGSPLPINHQNAFPLQRHEHHQDGGGPTTDADPVKQIERLALWDNSAAKVVQTNHPNIPQILGDRDLDGKPDDGFRAMLGWMDVVEIHPIEKIFTPPSADVSPEAKNENRVFFWMQLLNLGYRIPGVVNTDAHYNFHGSGWLRNYMACSTDNPNEISVEEMIHAAEHGHMVMTTGPFLQAELVTVHQQKINSYICGQDVPIPPGTLARLNVRVQCPNWFDVNRVQVFANGRPVESLNFTRQSHPQLFSDRTVRFQHSIELPTLDLDTHLIVATIGENLTLGTVMGPQFGKLPPVAITNPFFVDVDGHGFQANGDHLGVPFMLEGQAE